MFAFLHKLWKRVLWWWTGGLLSVQLEDKTSETRSDAEHAVERVVFETNIAHDCVSATILHGGPCILVEHDGAKEAFIHNSYNEAATKAIQWLRANDVRYSEQSKLSRKERRAFASYRRKVQNARGKLQ
jgi:hypothetical protein